MLIILHNIDIRYYSYATSYELFKADKASLVVAEITASEALGK